MRLGSVTGVGHARLIRERFGRFWAWFSVGDLFFLNFLTIVTEFIGVSLGLAYFGVPPTLSVPIAALALLGFTVTGSFRRWERFMFVLVAVSLLFVPLLVMTHPHGPVTILRHTFIPGVQGGVSSAAILLLVAIVGTTIAPWQLFFQQSNVIDKRITPRWIRYERADTVIGAFLTNIAAGGYVCFTAFAVAGTAFAGKFTDAGGVADALHHTVGYWAGALFAIILIDASIIGAACVTLSSAYAFGDTFNLKHSLHRKWSDAKGFYGAYALQVAFAAAIVLIPGAPLGTLTEYVQVLAGVLLPSATLFLLLLCNDQGVLGPWVNRAVAERPDGRDHRRPRRALPHPHGERAVPVDRRADDDRGAVRRDGRLPSSSAGLARSFAATGCAASGWPSTRSPGCAASTARRGACRLSRSWTGPSRHGSAPSAW